MKKRSRVITESEEWDLRYEQYKRAYNKKAEKYAMKRMWDKESFIEEYKDARKLIKEDKRIKDKSPLNLIIKKSQMMTFSKAKEIYESHYDEKFTGFNKKNSAKFRGIATLSFVSTDEVILNEIAKSGQLQYVEGTREEMRNMNAYYYVKYMIETGQKTRKEALEDIGY